MHKIEREISADTSLQIKKKRVDWSKHVFLIVILVLPLSAFVFYDIICNINSILLSIRTFDSNTGDFRWANPWYKNFDDVLTNLLTNDALSSAIKNSVFTFVTGLLFMPVSLFIAYAITEKVPMFGFYKIILFIPSILCTMAVAAIGKNVITFVIPKIFNNPALMNALTDDRQFITLWLFSLFWGFAGNMVLCLGAMGSVSIDLKEYAQIDGLGRFGILLHVVLPAIYPTLSTFIIVSFVGMFTSQGMAFVFFADMLRSDAYTLGYYLFMQVYKTGTSYAMYPYAAAVGIGYTLIAAPLTIGLRALLEKIGPKEE